MAYHTRTPITNDLDFHAFTRDRITKGEAYMRCDGRDVCLDYTYNLYGNDGCASLYVSDVTNAFKTGKMCKGFWLEARGQEAIQTLDGLLAAVDYDITAFIDWCGALEIDYEVRGEKYVDQARSITISERESKGVETFSPLALAHLKPLKEIPKKWTLSHVRRLLAAKQYSYCGTELRLTDDYAYDAASEFGKGECSGEAFLKELTEDSSGWRVSKAGGHCNDGDSLAVWCHSFEKRVIKIDLNAGKAKVNESKGAKPQPIIPVIAANLSECKPAGILMH